jgi:hypothetical protein
MPELKSPVWDLGLTDIGQTAFAGSDGREMPGTFVSISKK